MIYDLFREGFTIQVVLNLFARVFVMFCILPVHEFAHALLSTKLGDQTARLSGRLTLNPLAHLDFFGALLMLIAGFGYAKPVPVNMNNFPPKRRKSYMALTALAGPLSNLIMAFVFSIFYCAVFRFGSPTEGSMAEAVLLFFLYVAQINVSLAVFNLIPVPPLDGSRILTAVLPDRYYYTLMKYERYIVYAVLALVLFGALDTPISLATTYTMRLFIKLAGLIFGLHVG